jgi:hypothetical protein
MASRGALDDSLESLFCVRLNQDVVRTPFQQIGPAPVHSLDADHDICVKTILAYFIEDRKPSSIR